MIRILAPFVREQAQATPCTRDHRSGLEQAALGHGKPVKALVLFQRPDAPLRQVVGNVWSELLEGTLEPFRGNLAHAGVKVSAHAVQVYSEDQPVENLFVHSVGNTYSLVCPSEVKSRRPGREGGGYSTAGDSPSA
jgi:hypothetical protein